MINEEECGPIKLKDGLYLGDCFAARHMPSILETQTTHIVNCCAGEVPNHFETLGIRYLAFDWLETDTQLLFDKADLYAARISEFIDEAHANFESVLVHSNRGRSRSCIVLSLYFIKKYSWGLYKVLEFLDYRVPGLELKQSLFNELLSYENRLKKQGLIKSCSWDIALPDPTPEETLLKHTFYNAKKIDLRGNWPQKQRTGTKVAFKNERNKIFLYSEQEAIVRPKPLQLALSPTPILRQEGVKPEPKHKSQRVLSEKNTNRRAEATKEQERAVAKSRSICDNKKSTTFNKASSSPLYNAMLRQRPQGRMGFKENLDKSIREKSFVKEQPADRVDTENEEPSTKMSRQVLKRMLSAHISQIRKADSSFRVQEEKAKPKPVKPNYDVKVPPKPMKREEPAAKAEPRSREKSSSLRKAEEKKLTPQSRQKTPPLPPGGPFHKSVSGRLKA